MFAILLGFIYVAMSSLGGKNVPQAFLTVTYLLSYWFLLVSVVQTVVFVISTTKKFFNLIIVISAFFIIFSQSVVFWLLYQSAPSLSNSWSDFELDKIILAVVMFLFILVVRLIGYIDHNLYSSPTMGNFLKNNLEIKKG